jgi:hypothetical protein
MLPRDLRRDDQQGPEASERITNESRCDHLCNIFPFCFFFFCFASFGGVARHKITVDKTNALNGWGNIVQLPQASEHFRPLSRTILDSGLQGLEKICDAT